MEVSSECSQLYSREVWQVSQSRTNGREELGAGGHLDKHHCYEKDTEAVNFSNTQIPPTEAPGQDLLIWCFLFGLAEPTAARVPGTSR